MVTIRARGAALGLSLIIGSVLATSCTTQHETDGRPGAVTVDTTVSGITRVTYGSIPRGPLFNLTADLEIGRGAGVVFGDIRGIALAGDSLVLVLDYQASELRAFDLSGADRGLVMSKGEGPREIETANGVVLDDHGGYWINDHGRFRLTHILPDGRVETVPFFVPGFQYLWDGGVTDDGRIWTAWSHGSGPPPSRRLGLVSGTSRGYYKSYDPATGMVDSVFVGETTGESIVLPRAFVSVPFQPKRLEVLDPAGAIWTAMSDRYRLVRLSLSGDTLLVVDVQAEAASVSPDEREKAIASVEKYMAGASRVAVDWDAALPERKPILQHLAVDDKGNVWVQREAAGKPVLDGYTERGGFLGTLAPTYTFYQYFPPVIRGHWLLAVHSDSLDVESVIGSRLPTLGG